MIEHLSDRGWRRMESSCGALGLPIKDTYTGPRFTRARQFDGRLTNLVHLRMHNNLYFVHLHLPLYRPASPSFWNPKCYRKSMILMRSGPRKPGATLLLLSEVLEARSTTKMEALEAGLFRAPYLL